MIESKYWKSDLLDYIKKLKKMNNKQKPTRRTEKAIVNFEKDIIIACFIVRKLIESNCVSLDVTVNHKAHVYRMPRKQKVINNHNYTDIFNLYDWENSERFSMGIKFLCNQLIHGGATFTIQDNNKKWFGIITCSEFERQKYIYMIPIREIINALSIAANDYPEVVEMNYNRKKKDYEIMTYSKK